MMAWEKQPPYTGDVHQGCLHAPAVETVASLEMVIAVGFGDARVTKDDELIFSESPNDEEYRTLAEFEEMARADPDHDWRACLDAPLRSCEYQRHDEGRWVLIESGPGFA